MLVRLAPLLLAAAATAAMPVCGARASFEVTQDGGTNFEGEVRVPRATRDAKGEM